MAFGLIEAVGIGVVLYGVSVIAGSKASGPLDRAVNDLNGPEALGREEHDPSAKGAPDPNGPPPNDRTTVYVSKDVRGRRFVGGTKARAARTARRRREASQTVAHVAVGQTRLVAIVRMMPGPPVPFPTGRIHDINMERATELAPVAVESVLEFEGAYSRPLMAAFQTAAGFQLRNGQPEVGTYGERTRQALIYFGATTAPPAIHWPGVDPNAPDRFRYRRPQRPSDAS